MSPASRPSARATENANAIPTSTSSLYPDLGLYVCYPPLRHVDCSIPRDTVAADDGVGDYADYDVSPQAT